MYKPHPVFKPELPPNTRLWRYMDFTKFVSLLSTHSLFFVRLDKLTEEDRWEGTFPESQWKNRLKAAKKANDEIIMEFKRKLEDAQTDGYPQVAKHYADLIEEWKKGPREPEIVKNQRSWTGVSCWHENEHESAAMWRLYLTSKEGIAIETTFAQLKETFSEVAEDVFIGWITYIDYNKENIPANNLLHPMMTKRKSFEHEKEVRAVIWRGLKGSIHMMNTNEPEAWNYPGEPIQVNIDTLIKAVHIAPGSPRWFLDVVQNVAPKYGLVKSVEYSELDKAPII